MCDRFAVGAASRAAPELRRTHGACGGPRPARLAGPTTSAAAATGAPPWRRSAPADGPAGAAGGRERLRQAAGRTGVFHAQDGFWLRTSADGVWVPVNITIARLHVRPRPLALLTARDARPQRETIRRLEEKE